ncbi:MAG: SOS response-associated peptidase family protein, partial [Enterococcus casseliflavus]|nr:SOS response-associated peptidase family protein [Enterococcus casseliflavus]
IRVGFNEIFPTNYIVTLGLNQDSRVVPGITQWGFQGFKPGQLMINARSETVEEKKTFSKAFRETRCVIPVSGFYEWDSEKRKLLFTAGDNDVFYLGGFYRVHKTGAGFETESIIMTTKPNESVSPIHDRMPLIIQRDHIKDWITDLDFARNYLTADMPELTRTEVAK